MDLLSTQLYKQIKLHDIISRASIVVAVIEQIQNITLLTMERFLGPEKWHTVPKLTTILDCPQARLYEEYMNSRQGLTICEKLQVSRDYTKTGPLTTNKDNNYLTKENTMKSLPIQHGYHATKLMKFCSFFFPTRVLLLIPQHWLLHLTWVREHYYCIMNGCNCITWSDKSCFQIFVGGGNCKGCVQQGIQ